MTWTINVLKNQIQKAEHFLGWANFDGSVRVHKKSIFYIGLSKIIFTTSRLCDYGTPHKPFTKVGLRPSYFIGSKSQFGANDSAVLIHIRNDEQDF